MSVTIKELTEAVAADQGITKKAAEQVIASTFSVITNALKGGQEVTVRDFGRFYGKVKPARTARNPRTGESVQVAEKTVYRFTPRGAMK